MKYVLEIAYRGTHYHGWQVQNNAHSVQAELNNALSIILKLPMLTLGSGRTDTGVHAEQQYAQFESPIVLDPVSTLFKLNNILPKDIFVKNIFLASDDFNVRHGARKRSYEYRISRKRNPFLDKLCYFLYQRDLDIDLMNEAAAILLRHTNFQSFSKYKTSVNHFECTITQAVFKEEGDIITFYISANRFLRGMVRAIVGTLLEVGLGIINLEEFEAIILQRDRKAAKFAVPPEGLFLTLVEYPEGELKLLV